MIVYFSSASGFTHKFVSKLGVRSVRIPLRTPEAELFTVSEDFVLITPTYGASGKGFVPKQVIKFLNQEQNRNHCLAVIGSGNTNFGADYARAAGIVSRKLGIPHLYSFELAGTPEDVDIVKEGVAKFWREVGSR